MPKLLILVVEEEPTLTQLLTRLLKREGFAVEAAGSAGKARQRLEQGGVGLVIADFELSDQNGALLLAEVRRQHPAVKRILLSSMPDSPAIGQALQHKDAEALILKPWDQAQLLSIIGTVTIIPVLNNGDCPSS